MSLTDAHLLLHKTGDTPYPSKKTETIIWGGTSPFHTYKETRLGSARLFFSRVRRVYSTWFKKLQFRSESSSPSSLQSSSRGHNPFSHAKISPSLSLSLGPGRERRQTCTTATSRCRSPLYCLIDLVRHSPSTSSILIDLIRHRPSILSVLVDLITSCHHGHTCPPPGGRRPLAVSRVWGW
jgi:hypothetical protein